MLRIAICDDNTAVCSEVEKMVLEYTEKNAIQIEVEVFYTGEALIHHIETKGQFDLIFLDIELGTTTGIEIGKVIRNAFNDYISKIVFISATTGYERQLFDVQPLNFLDKPVDPMKLAHCLELVIKMLRGENNFFEYKVGHGIIKCNIKEILYFEKEAKKIKIVTFDSEDYFYDTMVNLKTKLPDMFVETHSSFLVNFHHIKKLTKDYVVMVNRKEIPISQRNLKNVRNILIHCEKERG